MSISVVIATYNRAPLLRRTLEQLREQQYQPGDEVIVVDNGSTDATADVIADAASRSPVRLYRVEERTPGKGAAVKTGVATARGEILAFTDDDVLVATDWIATIRAIFCDAATMLVGGRVDPWWEVPAPSWLQFDRGSSYDAMASPLALLHYGDAQELGHRTAVGANLAVRRSAFTALGGFAPHLSPTRASLLRIEDHDLCRRAVSAGFRCEYRPELRVRHWVPAKRLRVGYFLRWSLWAGAGHALVGTDDPIGRDGRRRRTPWYYLRHVCTEPLRAGANLLRGRAPDAVEHAMGAAFAAGYVMQHFRARAGRAGSLTSTECHG